jgi:hypothetical protein
MSTRRKTDHLRRPRPAASRSHRPHRLPYPPRCPFCEDPGLLWPPTERFNALVDFLGLQGYQPEGIIEVARIALDICVAGHPNPDALRRNLAELVCQGAYWPRITSYSAGGRIYTSLICDAEHARRLSEAVTADFASKPIPHDFDWALSGEDGGQAALSAARVLVGALEAVLERIDPGSSRAFLDALRDDLNGGRKVRDRADLPDLWTYERDTR